MIRRALSKVASALVFSAALALPVHAETVRSYPFTKAAAIAGARFFADHCSACHAVSSLRYNRLAQDLGMSEAAIKQQIMLPGGANYLKGMRPAMTQGQAKKWLGMPPPNLSHLGRALGSRFLFTYLTSFYWDPERPSGWNNHVFPNVAMPDVLAPWGGVYTKDGKLLKPGSEPRRVYLQQVADVVAFLRYASDPSVFERRALGRYVIGAFLVLAILAYLLKKDYWRDIWSGSRTTDKPSVGTEGSRTGRG